MADIANIPQIAPFVPDADPTSVARVANEAILRTRYVTPTLDTLFMI